MELLKHADLRLVHGEGGSETSAEHQAGRNARLLKEVSVALAAAAEALVTASLPDPAGGLNFYHEVRRFEIDLIRRALRQTGGNQARAARLLELKHTTLHAKIKQYNISVTNP